AEIEARFGIRALDGNLPERGVRVSGGELARGSLVRRNRKAATLPKNCRFHVPGRHADVLLRFELAIEQNLEQTAAKRIENAAALVRVDQDHGRDVMFGQVEHVALIAEQAATVVHDRNAPLSIDLQTHTVSDVVTDLD